MSMIGVNVNKAESGRENPVGDFDRSAGLILPVPTLDGLSVEHGKSYRLIQISDAEDLGLTAGYDATHSALCHYHIDEFFHIAPKGILHIVPVVKDTLLNMAQTLPVLPLHLRAMGIADYTPNDLGLESDANFVQGMHNGAMERMVHIPDWVIGTTDDKKTPRDFNCPNVGIVIASDPVTEDIVSENQIAAIGAVLGGKCVRGVHESLGSVDIEKKPGKKIGQSDYPLTDNVRGRWLSSRLTNGTDTKQISPAEAKDLTARGYIFADGYVGYGGVFFNSDPTCTFIESDYAYAHRNAIWSKAAIIVRNALLPKVKGKLPKRNGKIVARKIQSLKDAALGDLKTLMIDKGEIDAAEVIIPAEQTVTESNPLQVKLRVQAGDILHEMDIALGVVNEI